VVVGRSVTVSNPHGDLRVRLLASGDELRFDSRRVVLNGRILLNTVFERISWNHDLGVLGAEPGVRGTVFYVGGRPRLAVLPGKRLQVLPVQLQVNGRVISEPYLSRPMAEPMAPYKVPPGHYFVMGDNRNNSSDSRTWGPLASSRILGRAEVIFWPPSRVGLIR